MSATKTLLIFLVAFAAGATAAILLAPDSGKGTRKKLKKTFQQFGEEMMPVLQEMPYELDPASGYEEFSAADASLKNLDH